MRATELFQLLVALIFPLISCREICGGTYTEPKGVLQTPNFPKPFPVPLECKWIIDAQNYQFSNKSIIVYLTQLFLFEGLTFTEWQVYGRDYKVNGHVIHQVNETNIKKVRWIQTYQDFLVIKLKLESADVAHLRVFDRFLDVDGFNITYEITNANVRNDSCTMMDCGFTGVCYDHFTDFSCECFPGYEGKKCSDGPLSLCYLDGIPSCKNGGTCTHVGVSAVKCQCPKGFSGKTCETALAPHADCDSCRKMCPIQGRIGYTCQCPDSKNTTNTSNGKISTVIHLRNLPNLSKSNLNIYIKKQILAAVRFNSSIDVTVEKLIHLVSDTRATIHIYYKRKDERRLNPILENFRKQERIGNMTLSKTGSSSLSIESLSINHAGPIRENDEIIFACLAKGSTNLNFKWFKDGAPINVSLTNNKWSQVRQDPDYQDQATGFLGVERSQKEDEGTFTCQVEDSTDHQCLSYRIELDIQRPVIKIEPITLTARKGDNFSVKCFALDDHNSLKKYTYSWTKNKELLRVKSQSESYDILYPSGTILKIFNIEKDVQYSCLVQEETRHSEKLVTIHVVDGVFTCPKNFHTKLHWPETAPNTNSFVECPQGYEGIATRYCALRDGLKPVWVTPDYSECTSGALQNLEYMIHQLTLGYEVSTPEKLMQSFLNYIKNNQTEILPGEGARILALLKSVLYFINNSKVEVSQRNVTKTLFAAIDGLLMNRNSFTNQSHVQMLEELVSMHLEPQKKFMLPSKPVPFHLNYKTIDISNINSVNGQFYVPFWSEIRNKFTTNLFENKSTATRDNGNFTMVIFKNLSSFLPARLFLRERDGSEIEYRIYSHIINIFSTHHQYSSKSDSYIINFQHVSKSQYDLNNSNYETNFQCASATVSTFPDTWDIHSCQTIELSHIETRCVCPQQKIFSLLLTVTPFKSSKGQNNFQRLILVSGCSLCMMLTLFTTICLGTSCWVPKRSYQIILKLQCSISLFGTALLFTIATITGPQKNYFLVLNSALELFFLMGMSSHLSKILIVYTELVQVNKPVTSKQIVIGIISGVPIITVCGNYLAHRTMEIQLESWWMLVNTLTFNIYVTVSVVICFLFIFLYINVMKKLKELTQLHVIQAKLLTKRIAFLRRSGAVFAANVLWSLSSLIYINLPNSMWALYQFSISNILVGLLLLVCYVIRSESEFYNLFCKSSQIDNKFITMDSTSSPLSYNLNQ